MNFDMKLWRSFLRKPVISLTEAALKLCSFFFNKFSTYTVTIYCNYFIYCNYGNHHSINVTVDGYLKVELKQKFLSKIEMFAATVKW